MVKKTFKRKKTFKKKKTYKKSIKGKAAFKKPNDNIHQVYNLVGNYLQENINKKNNQTLANLGMTKKDLLYLLENANNWRKYNAASKIQNIINMPYIKYRSQYDMMPLNYYTKELKRLKSEDNDKYEWLHEQLKKSIDSKGNEHRHEPGVGKLVNRIRREIDRGRKISK